MALPPRDTETSTGVVSGRLNQWIDQRLPPQRSILLNRANVYIFPSKAGFSFLLIVFLLWLIATNYENNLVFGLAFLLASLFVVSILHTYSNLAGISITAVRSKPVFAGENVAFELLLKRHNRRAYENLWLSWRQMPPQIVNLSDIEQKKIKLYLPSNQRGWLNPGRLLVQTYYPLGLLRAWTRLDLDLRTLVYPKPITAGPIPMAQGAAGEGSIMTCRGTEDFYGLKEYQVGESLRHVAWKQYARGQGLYTKEYTASVDRRIWLDWDYLAGMNAEARLSRLCDWVLAAARTESEYGLRLPGQEIAPNQGMEHRDKLLKALALFDLNSTKHHSGR